jgi:hypothetical protein
MIMTIRVAFPLKLTISRCEEEHVARVQRLYAARDRLKGAFCVQLARLTPPTHLIPPRRCYSTYPSTCRLKPTPDVRYILTYEDGRRRHATSFSARMTRSKNGDAIDDVAVVGTKDPGRETCARLSFLLLHTLRHAIPIWSERI